jgi:hypothetical protein
MRINTTLIGTTLPIAAITVALFLVLDLVAGSFILDQLAALRGLDARFRTRHDIYHHALVPNYDGPASWGSYKVHRMCTDEFGFKKSCDREGASPKSYDIAFIGDSFTEGVGLPWPETFVGKIAARMPAKSVVNLGVVSYAPSIYLAKMRELLNQGFRFRQVVVYIDVNDIQDEAVLYRYDPETGAVLDLDAEKPEGSLAVPRIKRWARRVLPMTYQGYWWAANLMGFKTLDYSARSLWTVDINTKGYGAMGAAASVDKSVRLMTELHELLEQHGIRMSVGVYPWPVTLERDTVDSQQVRIWKAFCERRCEYFFNSFPSFFQVARDLGTEKAVEKLFIKGDVHHVSAGTDLIAQDFLEVYRQR